MVKNKRNDPLTRENIAAFHEKLDHWNIIDNKKIEKTLEFKNFKLALDFINEVGKIAENEGHHPDISLFNWNKVKFIIFTHTIGGLSENDFILATKIDSLSK